MDGHLIWLQTKTFAEKYFADMSKSGGQDLTGEDITNLNNFLCGLESSILDQIPDDIFK